MITEIHLLVFVTVVFPRLLSPMPLYYHPMLIHYRAVTASFQNSFHVGIPDGNACYKTDYILCQHQ